MTTTFHVNNAADLARLIAYAQQHAPHRVPLYRAVADGMISLCELTRATKLPTHQLVHVITTMCCTQLMKTALLENVFGYFAYLDPSPMLLQPKEDAAEQFSKERITPMVRATPVLRRLVGSSRTRSADETLLFKAFPGGFLALAGAGSPETWRGARSGCCSATRSTSTRPSRRATLSRSRRSAPPASR